MRTVLGILASSALVAFLAVVLAMFGCGKGVPSVKLPEHGEVETVPICGPSKHTNCYERPSAVTYGNCSPVSTGNNNSIVIDGKDCEPGVKNGTE